MSSFTRETKNPKTGKWEAADWIDNYFGGHRYGIKFPSIDIVLNADEYELETRANTLPALIRTNMSKEQLLQEFRDKFVNSPTSGVLPDHRDGGRILREELEKFISEAYESGREEGGKLEKEIKKCGDRLEALVQQAGGWGAIDSIESYMVEKSVHTGSTPFEAVQNLRKALEK